MEYDAFIACSESDAEWASRLAQRLEHGPAGSRVRRSLRRGRFFRDGAEGAADFSLPETTMEALEASGALIVLCSPAAGKSHHLNEEIRFFKSRHPHRPVIPLIVERAPSDDERECFPTLLKFALDADGCVVDGPNDVEAADIRGWMDGRPRALDRIEAQLLGRPPGGGDFHALSMRAPMLNKRLGNMMNLALAAGIAALVLWHGLTTSQAFLDKTLSFVHGGLNGVASEAAAWGVPQSIVRLLLERGEKLLDGIAGVGPRTPALAHRKAEMLLDMARSYRNLGDSQTAKARADDAYRLLRTLRAEGWKDARLQCRLSVTDDALALSPAGRSRP